MKGLSKKSIWLLRGLRPPSSSCEAMNGGSARDFNTSQVMAVTSIPVLTSVPPTPYYISSTVTASPILNSKLPNTSDTASTSTTPATLPIGVPTPNGTERIGSPSLLPTNGTWDSKYTLSADTTYTELYNYRSPAAKFTASMVTSVPTLSYGLPETTDEVSLTASSVLINESPRPKDKVSMIAASSAPVRRRRTSVITVTVTSVSISAPPTEKQKQENASTVPIDPTLTLQPVVYGKENRKVQKQREKKCDVRILDMRVGRIVDVKKHPNADTLYVEEIDCGESSPRTVIAADVERYTLEQMTDRPVVVLCNVKPAKMRGIYSKGMLMCAVSQDKLELLEPPEDSVPGDRISFEGYPLDAYPTRLLNPKKKIFRRVQRYLCINSDGIATYRGIPFSVTGRGVCTVPSLTNAEIK